MQCENQAMKTATIPPLRITPELRQAAESVLRDDETLSGFVESSLVRQIECRRMHQNSIARGVASREMANETAKYVTKEDSLAALDTILGTHRGAGDLPDARKGR